MSIMQRLTLIGLYNYDNTLFNGLTLPEQYDKNTFIDTLLIEHGEKLVLYSDYDFMKYSISAWGRKWSLELTRIAEALFAEYNPIWNYDRYEEWKDTGDKRGQSEIGELHNEETNTNASHIENGSSTSTSGGTVETEAARRNQTEEIKNGQSEETHLTHSDELKTTESEGTKLGQINASNTSNSETNTDVERRLINSPDYKEEKTTENVTDATTEHKVSADNDSDYQPASKDITNIGKNKVTTTATGDKDNITEISKTNSSTNENGNSTSEESQRTIDQENANATTNESGRTSGNTNESVSSNESGIDNSKTINSGNETTSNEGSGRNETNAKTEGGRNTKTNDSEIRNSDHVGHLWGNVGVTTSASMVTEVVEQRLKYNLYNTACRLFANELLIGIY